ncbi:hypothetical protein AGRO_2636 [Agrobacterium sp. ATCC 31749]|nr:MULTISPECIES: hypothetical protein [unclassified Agrobacterium]EGL64427.1 hypothetical protein AGRO_2636 [Agrobacterium sp. ATCC 31749]QKW95805.1 hypothetical protein GSF67_01040 [Agrobacterium sp. CGMCC 11546]
MDKKAIYQAIEYAVVRAVSEVGIENLKKTSMFMSNSRRDIREDIKLAA